jgi:putative membrane protein
MLSLTPRTAAIAVALQMTFPIAAMADRGVAMDSPVVPATLWTTWNLDLLILLNLGLLGTLYFRGVRRLWRKAGIGRGVARGQVAAYLGSLAVVFVALISPLDPLSEELASAHMVQHMLLMVVAAPLFMFGSPRFVLAWGLDRSWRPWVGRWRRRLDGDRLPLVTWGVYLAALWIWHLPAAYEAALMDPLVHDAQHLTFFAAACLFWGHLLDPLRRRRLHPLAAVVTLLTTSIHAMLLGVFMALSPSLWYEVYAERTAAWGLTPLEDQQLAGLIMWMPACLIYPLTAAMVIGVWLATPTAPEQRSLRPSMQDA